MASRTPTRTVARRGSLVVVKRIAMAFALVALVGGTIAALALRRDQRPQPPQQPPPSWAFVVDPPGTKPPVDDGTPLHVPGSSSAFTRTQLRDLHDVPDWHPGDHPPMPDVVAHGSKPGVFACAFCHLPNGLGRPENASLAGLRADYIVQQMADFKSGARKSSEPASLPVNLMIAVAKAATDAEVRAAADYFASLPAKPWIRVIEGATAPKTHAAGWMLVPTEPGATEPIGLRILEMPEDLERTELRDAASGFVAYVPIGSVAAVRRWSRWGEPGRRSRARRAMASSSKGSVRCHRSSVARRATSFGRFTTSNEVFAAARASSR